jgi:hypothetical protein
VLAYVNLYDEFLSPVICDQCDRFLQEINYENVNGKCHCSGNVVLHSQYCTDFHKIGNNDGIWVCECTSVGTCKQIALWIKWVPVTKLKNVDENLLSVKIGVKMSTKIFLLMLGPPNLACRSASVIRFCAINHERMDHNHYKIFHKH